MPKILHNETNKVSIIIPFFNREQFLAESVESLLAQTFQNWELILIDDGSTDNSSIIAQEFVNKYPTKIFLYSHKNGENRGASSSRNLGIKSANGDFITFLDSDDVFLPHTLEIEIAAFEQNPQADVVCGTLQYWFSWTEKHDKKERDFFVDLGVSTEKLYKPPKLLVHNLRAGGRKPGIGCVILKSEFAKQFDLFEDDFVYVGEDQIFWAITSLYAKIYVLEDCLAKYRQHSRSSNASVFESGDANADLEKFSVWLENYLIENKIEDQEVWKALKSWQKENDFREKYQWLINLYQRIFPFHIRYRVRDLIIKWRTRK